MSRSRSELFRKAILVGIGATALTAEKVNSFVDELVKKGEMSEQQAKSFKEEVREKAETEKESIESRITESTRKAIERVLKEIGVATVKDLQKLENRLNAKIEGKDPDECSEAKDHNEGCECEDCIDVEATASHVEDCQCNDCLDK